MIGNVYDALTTHTHDYQVRQQLHAVPPHAVYEVKFDGVRSVCKIAQGPGADPPTEARVIAYVGEHTSLPVPRILAIGDDHFVAEWCEEISEDPTVDEARLRAMGSALATLHTDAAEDFDTTGRLRTEGGDLAYDCDRRWSDTLCAFFVDCRDYLDAVGYEDVAEDAVKFVRNHRSLFDAVEGVTLTHGNFLPDHVGVHRGSDGVSVSCVIDFEHALVAPGEWDYVRTVLPLFRSRANEGAQRAFREAYESVRPLDPGFDRRREAYVAFNTVSYLKALHVQRTNLDAANGGVSPEDPLPTEEAARRARRLRTYVRTSLDSLRAERD